MLAVAFHRKRGPGADHAAPWDSWDEGAGLGKKSFLSQIPGLGSQRGTERERERERETGVRLCGPQPIPTAAPSTPGTYDLCPRLV